MSRICLNIKMELLEDTLFSSGAGLYGAEIATPRLDRDGRPFMPGSTLKGLLRESIENYLCWIGEADESYVAQLFGKNGGDSNTSKRLVFSDLKLEEAAEKWASSRVRMRLKTGSIQKKTTLSCVAAGLSFYGNIFCEKADVTLVEKGLKGIHWVGVMRSRGMGRVRLSVCSTEEISQVLSVPESCWIHYRLRLETPMIISWAERSDRHEERGSYTESRDYLPGAAVRGMVMGVLSQQDSFPALKRELLSNVNFGDAYPVVNGRELIPTPKGFYSDRQQSCFYSVLDQEVQPGHKRAVLGNYCYIENGVIYHHSPNMQQRVRVSKQSGGNSGSALSAGTELSGYIYLPDPTLAPLIAGAFSNRLQFGMSRFAGNGQCTLTCLDTQMPEYFSYGEEWDETFDRELYMMSLSAFTMQRHGDPCGIDTRALAAALEVSEVQVLRCATSVVEFGGYNSTWNAPVPVDMMYSPGSVFRLFFSKEIPTQKALLKVQQTGLGLRTAEGFGRVLFLKDLSKVSRAQSLSFRSENQMDTARWRSVRCAWLLDTPFPDGISNRLLTIIQQLARNLIDGKPGAESELRDYLGSLDTMHISKQSKRQKGFGAILQVLDRPIGETLHCPDYPDSMTNRVWLYLDWIEVNRRKGY